MAISRFARISLTQPQEPLARILLPLSEAESTALWSAMGSSCLKIHRRRGPHRPFDVTKARPPLWEPC
jgi:hypothetical protein